MSRRYDIGGGWTLYDVTFRKYFHCRSLRIVTQDDMSDPAVRDSKTLRFQSLSSKYPGFEIFASSNPDIHHVIDHSKQEMDKEGNDDGKKPSYWSYIHNFPSHHPLPFDAEKQAVEVLQFAAALNTVSSEGIGLVFSSQEIKVYRDAFEYSEGNSDAHSYMVAAILSNYYQFWEARRLDESRATSVQKSPTVSARNSLYGALIVIAGCGMPPRFSQRFEATLRHMMWSQQPASWATFLARVRGERGGANLVSGLLLASSVAFLAIPGLVDISQFFIIASLGLSLASVVMGFNGEVEEKLVRIESCDNDEPQEFAKNVRHVSQAMDHHFRVLLLSILCFFLAVFTFALYSVFNSPSVPRAFNVPHLFFALACAVLVVLAVFLMYWNRRYIFHRQKEGELNDEKLSV